MRNVICSALAIVLLIAGCSKKVTQPTQINPDGSVFLSRLVVSMVPGGSETVNVIPSVAGASQASSDNPAIATAQMTDDSTLVVTGVAFGTTTVTVSDPGGEKRALPVQVYDYRVLDTGELLISYTDQFERIYSFGVGRDTISFWRPIAPTGFSILGTFMKLGGSNPSGHSAVMVVQGKPGTDAVVMTSTFEPAISGALYNPVAPSGYKALGQVLVHGGTTFPVACVREDLTTPGKCLMFFSYKSNSSNYWESAWEIGQPASGVHEGAYLAPGMGVYEVGYANPGISHPAVNVLKVKLPMLAAAPAQDYAPSMTGYGDQPDGTAPTLEKAMLVPCTIVKDGTYDGNMPWRIANSPFYRLERHVYYKYITSLDNRQSPQVNAFHYEITSGISNTESQTVWNKTGVELSATYGLSIYGAETSITATVNREFGFETTESVTRLEMHTLTVIVNVSPHKVAALWQRWNRFILYRHNGTRLEPVTSWECGTDDHAIGEYPAD